MQATQTATAAATTSSPVDPSVQAQARLQHRRLVAASQQFEALLLGELLKPMSRSASLAGGEDATQEEGVLKSYGMEAMATAMAKSNALGFGRKIVEAVESRDEGAGHKKVAEGTHATHPLADNPRGGN